MRTIVLLPLTALMAVAAGCGSNVREQGARSVPQRDLTLMPQAPGVQIASPVEMQQVRTSPTVHHSQWATRLVPAPRSTRLEPKLQLAAFSTPAPVPAVPQPVAQPSTPANDRELLPGKTVTVIPVSSGPSTGTDKTDGLPADRGRTMIAHGGGGTCRGRGRGPGIGMAPAPRPDFR